MKLLFLVSVILFSSVGFASEEEYIEITYKRPNTPIEITMSTKGSVYLTCAEGNEPAYAGYETFLGNNKIIEAIPTGGSVDPANEDCENPQHEELWLTRADGNLFLAYQKTCLDNVEEEDNFSNGGRVYYTGDAEVDEEMRNSILDIWVRINAWNELNGLFQWCGPASK